MLYKAIKNIRSAIRKKIEEVAKKFNYNYAEETNKEFEVPSITEKVKEIQK